jgi:hypothetical protein
VARKGFNLSAAIREHVSKDEGISFAELWAMLTASHRGLNEGTAKATFYKLRGAGKKRKVRRLKPSRNGFVYDGLSAALKFVREAGSVEAAKAEAAYVVFIEHNNRFWPQSYLSFVPQAKTWNAEFTIVDGHERPVLVGRLTAEGKALCDYYFEFTDALRQWNQHALSHPLESATIHHAITCGVHGFPGFMEIGRITVSS